MKSKKSLALIGIGRWGKNLLREFDKVANVQYVYHRDSLENLQWLKKNYPKIKTASSYQQLLDNTAIDAVVIATPIKTHFELAKKALLAGKHVFVEKPIANKVKQAQELVKLVNKKKRILFVGHIFSYHPILAKIKSTTRHEPIKYAAFVWNKLGTFGEELIFNLLSHDVAIAFDLFGKPTSIKTLENRSMVTDSDIIYARLNFPNNCSCTIYINRVSNLKNKTATFVTGKNVYLWKNDQLFKLDKKANAFKLVYPHTSRGVRVYKSTKTPLEIECAEFIKCLEQNKKPHTSGEFGLEVVKILAKI